MSKIENPKTSSGSQQGAAGHHCYFNHSKASVSGHRILLRQQSDVARAKSSRRSIPSGMKVRLRKEPAMVEHKL
jgi:hypothetical protein